MDQDAVKLFNDIIDNDKIQVKDLGWFGVLPKVLYKHWTVDEWVEIYSAQRGYSLYFVGDGKIWKLKEDGMLEEYHPQNNSTVATLFNP